MKTLIFVTVLSVFAYASVGALMKSVETTQNYNNKVNNAIAMLDK